MQKVECNGRIAGWLGPGGRRDGGTGSAEHGRYEISGRQNVLEIPLDAARVSAVVGRIVERQTRDMGGLDFAGCCLRRNRTVGTAAVVMLGCVRAWSGLRPVA